MRIEILAPAVTPDADVADIPVADEAVGIHAPVQSVAGKKIVEEFGPHQFALRHDLRDQSGLAPRLELERDRIAVLKINIVVREILGIHVQEHGLLKTPCRLAPDKGSVVVRLKEFEQMMSDGFANVALGQVF